MDKIKYGRMWATDGSFYTEDLNTIKNSLTGLYIDGKKDYTLTDSNGRAVALIQINY